MSDKERIGVRIAQLRKNKNLSQAKLAQMTGLDAGHIARIELGQYSAGIDTLSRIGKALGYQLDFTEL